MTSPWWKENLRILHINHNRDDMERMDTARLIRGCKEMHANAVVLSAGGIYAWYPTRVRFHHVDPAAEGVDYFGECAAEVRAAGIRLIARIDFSRGSQEAYEVHPDWFSVDRDSLPHDRGGRHATCPTSPYRNEGFAEPVIREIAERYDVDGFHLNAGGFRQICYCRYCQAAFQAHAGLPIPSAQDWDNPSWIRYMLWRRRAVATNTRFLYDVMRSVRPDMFFMGELMGPGVPVDRWSMFPRELADAYSTLLMSTGEAIPVSLAQRSPWWVGMAAKVMRAYCSDVQPLINLKASYRAGGWPKLAVPADDYTSFYRQALANNAGAKLAVFGTLDVEDKRSLSAIGEGFGFAAAHEQKLGYLSPVADVALVWPARSATVYGRGEGESRVCSHFYGAYQSLVEAHIPFVVLDEEALAETDLRRYKTLFLPNVAALSAAERKALEEYVSAGGGLVATYETGRWEADELSGPSEVADALFGAHRASGAPIDQGHGYVRVTSEHPLAAGLGAPLLPHVGAYVRCTPAPGNTSLPLALHRQVTIPEEFDSPEDTGDAVVVTSERGAGRVVYLANTVDRLYWEEGLPDCARLLTAAVHWAMGTDSLLETNAPASVETTVFESAGKAVVHLCNATGTGTRGSPPVPVADVQLSLNLSRLTTARLTEAPETALSARTLAGGNVSIVVNGVHTHITLDQLRGYEGIVITNGHTGCN